MNDAMLAQLLARLRAALTDDVALDALRDAFNAARGMSDFTEYECELVGGCPRCATMLRLMKTNTASIEAELRRTTATALVLAREHYAASLNSLANCESLSELHAAVQAFETEMTIEHARARPTEH